MVIVLIIIVVAMLCMCIITLLYYVIIIVRNVHKGLHAQADGLVGGGVMTSLGHPVEVTR